MLYSIIKKHIDALDPQELLSSGAPKDEYDIESELLAHRLSPEQSPEEMAAIMAALFAGQFSCAESPGKYLETARKIYGELHQAS